MNKGVFGYFIVKPDGAKNINGILDNIENGFSNEIIRYYKVDEFDSVVNKLYYKHFERKGNEFKKSFSDYLRALKEIYGNKALLILIESKTKNYNVLGKEILNKKIELRNNFVRNDMAVITNNVSKEPMNRILLTDLNFNSMKQRLFNVPGNYRISDFNVIHSPDADENIIKDELNILYGMGIFKSENMLNEMVMNNVRKYKTFEVLNVDKREIGIEYPSVGEHMMDSVRRGY